MAMKIDSTISQSTSMTMPRAASDVGVRGAAADFGTELADQKSSMSREAMDRLLEKIDAQGARLSKSPTYEELRSYRALIQSFIGEAVDVTGWLGGYNFQWAWASAWVAARALGNH